MSWLSAYPFRRYCLHAGLSASVCLLAPLLAQAQSQPPKSKGAKLDKSAKVEDKNAPVILRGEELRGRPEREVQLLGNAELVRDKTIVNAASINWLQLDNEVQAEGGVRMRRFDDVYTGERLRLNLDTGAGMISKPSYRLELNSAQGRAERVDFIDQEQAVVVNGTYSTCEGTDPAWYLQADTLHLDFGRDVGAAGKTLVYFKHLPILGTPALSFPLTSARRSGVLPPTFGATSNGGLELTVPYYFNIAPNRDLTLYPKLIARRGLQLGANARYLGTDYRGETNLEVLPGDRKAGRSRYSLASLHSQQLTQKFSFGWNLNTASDDAYPTDFAGSLAISSQRQLVRELRFDYQGSFWNASARVQNYQILQDPESVFDPSLKVNRPYDRLPEFNWNGVKRDVAGFDFALDAQWTYFWHPDEVRGQRLVFNPQISYPLLHPAGFLTPRLSLHSSSYNTEARAARPGVAAQAEKNLNRFVPTFSLDGGLVFERPVKWGGDKLTQTLEPRLFYVNTPYREQSQFPLFDTAEAGFNFAQLFAENRFTGHDRISDANQVTLAVVSRLLESSGAERMRFALGQRFYFRNQRVQLDPNGSEIRDSRSDILLSAAGQLTPTINFDSGLQYSVSKHQVYAANYGVQWAPQPKHVLNAEYRYLRNSFELLNVSGQWPLAGRYYAVGRISYSLPERQTVKSLAGFEYNADCWVFRFAAQRFSTSTKGATTTLFLQLELNGLSRLGSNPIDALSKNIPGYQKVNQPD
ncbi:LPS assembly protein LptD [Massilia sp. W12]|uniref:LPS-assembly protein LptD n=1 Tax=Massilia sp. W12 TaxID=3126507 RepID=UPI0030D30068